MEAFPESAAVTVPAEKLPLPSRATIVEMVFEDVAVVAALGMEEQESVPLALMALANWFAEQSAGFAASAVAVSALPVTLPVKFPLNVPVVVPGSVGLVGMLRVIAPVLALAAI